MERERSIPAIKVAPRKRQLTYREGRQCRLLGCGVRLSRYNAGEYCGVHTPPDYRVPAVR
jgi:hypothetical protein